MTYAGQTASSASISTDLFGPQDQFISSTQYGITRVILPDTRQYTASSCVVLSRRVWLHSVIRRDYTHSVAALFIYYNCTFTNPLSGEKEEKGDTWWVVTSENCIVNIKPSPIHPDALTILSYLDSIYSSGSDPNHPHHIMGSSTGRKDSGLNSNSCNHSSRDSCLFYPLVHRAQELSPAVYHAKHLPISQSCIRHTQSENSMAASDKWLQWTYRDYVHGHRGN